MKLYKISKISSLMIILTFALININTMNANAPSIPIWFQQINGGYDTTAKQFYATLKWKDGIIDENHPKAEGYYLYRSMLGHNKEIKDFDLVATIESENQTIDYTYTDKMNVGAGYYYYLKAYSNGLTSEISPLIDAYTPGSYCVNLDAEIVDFLTFPSTLSMPGELYVYESYAKHRSFRVQGMVRYSLLEFPEGMLLDEKNGKIEWEIPSNASGEYYVKLKAYSLEDSRAESIQEWYIRIASQYEIIAYLSSVDDDNTFSGEIKLYPNPASNFLTIQFDASENPENFPVDFEILNLEGMLIVTEKAMIRDSKLINTINLDISNLSPGTYFIRIGKTLEKFIKN